MQRWLLALGLGLGGCPGAHGFAADPDPEVWSEAWRIVDASPLPSPSGGRDGGTRFAAARTYQRIDNLYRTLRRDGADAPQRLTPSVQGYFWSVLYNFTGAFTDVWHTDAPRLEPSPSPEPPYEEDDYDYSAPSTEADFSYESYEAYEAFARLRSNEHPYEEEYDYEYSTWPWEFVDADPSPVLRSDEFDYDVNDYDYSSKLYYWNGDETP